MTDEQDGQPRRPPVDGPTVMGPSTGHLHGPGPEEPAGPAPQDERTPTDPGDGPAVAAPSAPATTRLGSPATTPPNDPTLGTPTDPSPPPTPANNPNTPDDEPTLANLSATAATRPDAPAPHHEPTLTDPASPPTRASNPPNTPDDEPTVADPAAAGAVAPWPGAPTAPPQEEPALADPAPATPSAATWPSAPAPRDESTLADTAPATPSAATRPSPPAPHDEPTLADAPSTTMGGAWPGAPAQDETTVAGSTAWSDGPTVATPVDVTVPDRPDEPTMAVVDESPTTTGPTVGGWPLDELLPPPPTDLVWRPDVPEPAPASRRPAYYIALGASVVLVVALVAVAAFATVVRPAREVAGTARAAQAIPDITGSAPPPTATSAEPQTGPAEHPLSTSTARMADATCALPRFDLADDRQAAFYAAAKTCADDAWRGVLAEAGLTAAVEVVTVTGPVRTASCGEITPTSPAAQCDGTVYMTPAHLRDTEANGRYPGRYLGVFLREYARALQFTTGLADLTSTVDEVEVRLAQQATCMAGMASGAMANRGAVDANITGEIGDRLSSVDAPPDAKSFLDKGFEERNLKACNTW